MSACEFCAHYLFDEEEELYYCDVSLDEDEMDVYLRASDVMLTFIADIKAKTRYEARELDLGGGFAIDFTDKDKAAPVEEICKRIVRSCEDIVNDRKLSLKIISIEPGRSVVGDNAYTIYTAGNRKRTFTKRFLFVDGGMADNIRPALYQAEYQCVNLSREDAVCDQVFDLAGKCCESGDVLVKGAKLPEPLPGDLILVYSTGAYGYSMASNYNRLGRPPVVFIKGNSAREVLRRETYDDMYALESDKTLF